MINGIEGGFLSSTASITRVTGGVGGEAGLMVWPG